jgi:MIP family channel proteins
MGFHFNLSKWLAEYIGTFGILFFGCGSIMVSSRFPQSIDPQSIPLIFGLVVATMIYTLGHISGAHFNPAVTLGFVVARHFPLKEMLSYWSAQFVGAISAITLLHCLLPMGAEYGATLFLLPTFKAFLWEIVLSFFLMLVIIAVATDTRVIGIIGGAAIGMVVALDAYIAGPITGASMNPARSLAPALYQGTTNTLWIYFAGPAIGTIFASLFYRLLRCEESTPKDAKGCC